MDQLEKRAFLAIVLCLAILLVWQVVFFKKVPRPRIEEPAATTEKMETTGKTSKIAKPPFDKQAMPAVSEKDVSVNTDLFEAVFSTRGGALKRWRLKKYKDKVENGNWVEMIIAADRAKYPLSLSFSDPSLGNLEGAHYQLESQTEDTVRFVYAQKGTKIERTYVFKKEAYEFSHTTRIWAPQPLIKGEIFIGFSEGIPTDEKTNILFAAYADVRNFIYRAAGKTYRQKVSNLEEDKEIKNTIQWGGIENRYFISAMVNRSKVKPYLLISSPLPGSGAIEFQFPFYKETEADFFEMSFSGYIGPKEVGLLRAVEPGFDEAVDFGMFSFLCIPLLFIMNFFYKFCHNYGVAILLLTLLIRALFHPLTKKSLKAMREMQRIQPQIAKIKEKYKDDKQQMNKEVMGLMKANKVNPLGGCLPLLFQMPIFFALYRLLYNAIELYQAPFFGWIKDLSTKDPLYITPVLMGIAMFIQQKMTPTTSIDPVQQRMMMFMPIIFSFFMIALPSGLVLYILASTLLQIASQYVVNRDFAKQGL